MFVRPKKTLFTKNMTDGVSYNGGIWGLLAGVGKAFRIQREIPNLKSKVAKERKRDSRGHFI